MSRADPPSDGDLPIESLPVSDGKILARLREWGGEQLVEKMVEIILAQGPERIAAARTGLEDGSAKEVERAVHSLRSSSGQIGAMRLEALCAIIEPRAAAGDLTGLEELIGSLEREMQRYEAQTRM